MKKCVFLLAFFLAVKTTHACSCDSIKGLKESDAVFRGKVVAIKQMESTFEYEVLFRVSKKVKGTNTKTIKVIVPCLMVMCCGVDFEVDECWEVYAYKDRRGKLMTSNCTATHRLKK